MKTTLLTIAIFSFMALMPFDVVHGAGVIVCNDPPNCTFDELLATVNKIIETLIMVASGLGAVLFAYAGILYMTAGGDTGKISQAHGVLKATAIGFFIILAAWLLVKFVLDGLQTKDEFKEVLTERSSS